MDKKIKVGLVSARLADIQKKQLDSVARERAKQVARAAAVHLEAQRLAQVQQVAGSYMIIGKTSQARGVDRCI